jgi:chemotaxis response regulator CheB
MHMTSEYALQLTYGPKINFVQPNADLMFESAGRTYGDRAIGVVLSGAGSDAAIGSLAIAHAGGTVIAQDDRTCAFPQMPTSATSLGSVEHVMTPAEIALELERLVHGHRRTAKRPGSDPTAPPPIKVLLADDHKIVLDGLAVLINGEPDMTVVSATDDGASVIRLAAELAPDVVVMDIRMPPPDGIEATRQIVAQSQETRVVALSAENDPLAIDAVLRAGACGYVSKQRAFGELVQAIRTAVDGKVYLSPEVGRMVIAGAVAPPAARPRRRI